MSNFFMVTRFLKNLGQLSIISLLAAVLSGYSSIASAYYYAYVPDLSSGQLFIINTETGVLVDAVPLNGRTRDVLLNNKADTVYISTESEVEADNESFINYLDTTKLGYPKLLQVRYRDDAGVITNASNIRGMAISQDDNVLYVTHSTGVTIFNNIKNSSTWESVLTTYSGKSLLLAENDKLLFVLGSDGINPLSNGISIVNTET
ncbi:MAG: hypothetical protein R3240_03835, partial [Gammaproteobacteria bacterium]|nr:hypothetical protein [Gammaproteobacteria bacterium]